MGHNAPRLGHWSYYFQIKQKAIYICENVENDHKISVHLQFSPWAIRLGINLSLRERFVLQTSGK